MLATQLAASPVDTTKISTDSFWLFIFLVKWNAFLQCVVFPSGPLGTLSVYHCALPTMPTVCEKEPSWGAHNFWVPKETCVVSRLCGKLCLWGEKGIFDSFILTQNVSVAIWSPYDLVWLHLSSMNSNVPLPVWCASTVTWISSGTRWVRSHEKGLGWIKNVLRLWIVIPLS